MKSIATYLLSYLVAHILLISVVESFFCTDLKMVELGLIILVFGVAVVNSKKIILEKSDIIIFFLLAFLNIYYTFIEFRGLIFFKMTYVLSLAIILSKLILPNISLKSYLGKINTIYLVVLVGLVIEYLILLFLGDSIFTYLFMCHGEQTGVRGYIQQHNITKYVLPFHITGLNSIMMGSQTASQLSVIIFVWYLYKYKVNEERVYMAMAFLALVMLFLSPSITSLFLLFISIAIIFLIHLRSISNEKIKNFYKIYIVIFIIFLLIYLLFKLLTYKYVSLHYIYEEFILKNVIGFGYFSFKEILFGITIERELELFSVGEIYYINQFIKYGFVGVGVFYISILYFIIRALKYRNVMALTPNMIILAIFLLGNFHYPVMFNIGVMELFVLHLAYIIYQGSYIKK